MSGNGPTTPIEIQSNAALLLGKKPFTTIDDADAFALSIQKLYDMVVPAELGSGAWKFAKRQTQLSLINGFDPDFAEFSSGYDLPGDALNVVRIYPNVHYQIFENRIYTNTTSTLHMEYTYSVPVTRWNAPFKAYITAKIASLSAASVAENANLMQALKMEAKEYMVKAMFLDGQNSPNRNLIDEPWIRVRGSRYQRSNGGLRY